MSKYVDMDEDEIWGKLSQIASFKKTAEFMDDDDISHLLAQVVKIISKPNLPPEAAAVLIVWLTALSVKFRVSAKDLMYISKDQTDAAKRKGLYLTISDSIMDLVQSLKVLIRASGSL